MLSNANLLRNIESCRLALQTVEQDRIAVLLPMFDSYMLTVGLLLPLFMGGSIVLVKSLHPVRSVIQEIYARGATVLPGIPQFYRSMVNADVPAPLALRICISGSAPLPVQVLKEFEAKFRIPLIEGYGLSEASPVVAKNPLDGRRKPGSIGLPIPHVEMSVQDETGRELGTRENGEICVRGGNVMLGYWNHPEQTAQAIRHGWLLTGDIGYRDEEGYFFFVGRKKEVIRRRGELISPVEIESVINSHPSVQESAVIGTPSGLGSGEEEIKAYVRLKADETASPWEILSWCRGKLAEFKIPRFLEFREDFPRSAIGRIQKKLLKAEKNLTDRCYDRMKEEKAGE
jgi:long-chain acyl-CoA synthetase